MLVVVDYAANNTKQLRIQWHHERDRTCANNAITKPTLPLEEFWALPEGDGLRIH